MTVPRHVDAVDAVDIRSDRYLSSRAIPLHTIATLRAVLQLIPCGLIRKRIASLWPPRLGTLKALKLVRTSI